MSTYNHCALPAVCALLLCTWSVADASAVDRETKQRHLTCLVDAYPEHLRFVDESRLSVMGKNNTPYPYDPEKQYDSFEEELANADLYSQMRQAYPIGQLNAPPEANSDPGRLRYTPLFEDMYGNSKAKVAANLTATYWAPCQCNLQFSKVNGAAQALEQVGHKIKEAGLSGYVKKSLGTFNWRKIAGTQRLSMHSFGIAIDFELPKGLGRYWRWDKNHASGFPSAILQDEKLNQVVHIFEQHGFIWGGKWWHYDSIHFEYRPELIKANCANQ